MYFSCTFFTNIEKLRNRRVHEIMKNLGVICLFLHNDKFTRQIRRQPPQIMIIVKKNSHLIYISLFILSFLHHIFYF